MKDADGNQQIEMMVAHKSKVTGRSLFRCTCEIPGFNGLCVPCAVRESEAGTKWNERKYQVQEMEYVFAGVWDPNHYVLATGNNGRERYTIWQPRRPGTKAPDGAIIGGARYFRMGITHWVNFLKYIGNLEDVCTCVAKTNSPDLSLCTVEQAVCPECGAVVFDVDELDAEGTAQQIRENILNELHPCLDESEGGCWTQDNVADDHPGYILKPEYSCLNHVENGAEACPGATPCSPFMKPALVNRTGEERETVYTWHRDDSLSWQEWMDYEVPEEALEAFENGMDFQDKLRILSLEDQAKELGVSFPFEPAARAYGKEYKKSSNSNNTPQEDPRSKRRRSRRNK
jgi:hypothetical protein